MALPDVWQTQVAKAKFSRLIKAALEDGDQFISIRGEHVAVVMSKSRYDELTTPSDSLLEFFKNAPFPDVEIDL